MIMRSLDSIVSDVIYILSEMRMKKGKIKMSNLEPHSISEKQKYYRILKVMQKYGFVKLKGKEWIATERLRWRILE